PNRPDIAAEIQVLRGDPRSAANYSRFGGVIWTLIQGLWADAVLRQGRSDLFAQDLRLMAGQFCAAVQSPEIVHPDCGLRFRPCLPEGIECAELLGLPYR
ncbi:MAG: hypothetical protein WCG36_06880, partial [bacterium]